MNKDEFGEKAKTNFLNGYTCAQAVIAAFSKEEWFIKSGITLEAAMRLSSSFGGGMGRLREVCGAVSGMFMLAGLAYGFEPPVQGNKSIEGINLKTSHYTRIQELANAYKKENGSIVCKELLGLGQKDNVQFSPIPEPRTPEYYKKRPCAEFCQQAATIFAEYVYSHPIQN